MLPTSFQLYQSSLNHPSHKHTISSLLHTLGSISAECTSAETIHAKVESASRISAGVMFGKQYGRRMFTRSCSMSARRKRPAHGIQVASLSNESMTSDLVVCFGEMLIDLVPTVGGVSLADAPAFKKAAGGAPANVAVGISRMGGHSAFLGKVGDDEFGHMLASILEQNGVDTRGVLFDKGARTALAFVTLRADGEREFMFYRNPSADMLLTPEELDVGMITKAGIFHYGSISLITEPCRSAHMAAMGAAKEAGVLLSYDPNLRLPLWDSPEAARHGIRSIWEHAQVIKVSEEEISFLTEGGDAYSHEAARALFHSNLHLLLVTEGAAGCRYYTPETQGRVEGFKVDAVDTTGAGDAFVAAFLTCLSKDRSILKDEERLREILRFSNAAGAITTTERGAIPALPDTHKVNQLMTATRVV